MSLKIFNPSHFLPGMEFFTLPPRKVTKFKGSQQSYKPLGNSFQATHQGSSSTGGDIKWNGPVVSACISGFSHKKFI